MFKSLKNIEDKNEDQSKKQLDAIKNINISSKPLKTISLFSALSDEAKKLMVNIKQLAWWLAWHYTTYLYKDWWKDKI